MLTSLFWLTSAAYGATLASAPYIGVTVQAMCIPTIVGSGVLLSMQNDTYTRGTATNNFQSTQSTTAKIITVMNPPNKAIFVSEKTNAKFKKNTITNVVASISATTESKAELNRLATYELVKDMEHEPMYIKSRTEEEPAESVIVLVSSCTKKVVVFRLTSGNGLSGILENHITETPFDFYVAVIKEFAVKDAGSGMLDQLLLKLRSNHSLQHVGFYGAHRWYRNITTYSTPEDIMNIAYNL